MYDNMILMYQKIISLFLKPILKYNSMKYSKALILTTLLINIIELGSHFVITMCHLISLFSAHLQHYDFILLNIWLYYWSLLGFFPTGPNILSWQLWLRDRSLACSCCVLGQDFTHCLQTLVRGPGLASLSEPQGNCGNNVACHPQCVNWCINDWMYCEALWGV